MKKLFKCDFLKIGVIKTDSKQMSLFKWFQPFKKGHSFQISLYLVLTRQKCNKAIVRGVSIQNQIQMYKKYRFNLYQYTIKFPIQVKERKFLKFFRYTGSWHNSNSLSVIFNQCKVCKKISNNHLVQVYSSRTYYRRSPHFVISEFVIPAIS